MTAGEEVMALLARWMAGAADKKPGGNVTDCPHEWHFAGPSPTRQACELCYRCGATRPLTREAWQAREDRIRELTATKPEGT